MLLTILDSATASQLLKGLSPSDIQDIGIELARIESEGLQNQRDRTQVAKEFCSSLDQSMAHGISLKSFLNEMLINVLGREKANEVQQQIIRATTKRDPFIDIRSANIDELTLALKGEREQTIAVVLSELETNKSQEILSLLDDDVRLKVVRKMTNMEWLSSDMKQRIALVVADQLENYEGETLPEQQEQTLRKLALVLSGLEKGLRDRMIKEITSEDEQTGKMVRNLMVTWEDIPKIADRSLQEALRNVDSGKLAVALHGANEDIANKIRSNISERAKEKLQEEASLMQEPLEKEIRDAREEVVKPLREANEKDELRFIR